MYTGYFFSPPLPSRMTTTHVSHLGRLKQELMEAVKPGTQGMQGTHTRECIIQGSLSQELQLPIHTAKEVVHGHRVRPWPPRFQEGEQHLDPTDNDRLALFSLKHVTEELLDGLLPGEEESE